MTEIRIDPSFSSDILCYERVCAELNLPSYKKKYMSVRKIVMFIWKISVLIVRGVTRQVLYLIYKIYIMVLTKMKTFSLVAHIINKFGFCQLTMTSVIYLLVPNIFVIIATLGQIKSDGVMF